jgi:hypothetical protein
MTTVYPFNVSRVRRATLPRHTVSDTGGLAEEWRMISVVCFVASVLRNVSIVLKEIAEEPTCSNE